VYGVPGVLTAFLRSTEMKRELILGLTVFLFSGGLCLAVCPSADLTGDCSVDFSDFALIAIDWPTTDFNDVAEMANQWLYGGAISDHVFRISIEMAWDYEEPDVDDTEYQFEIEVLADDTVEKVEFLTPAGNTFEIPNTPEALYVTPEGEYEIGVDYYDDEAGYEFGYYVGFYDQNGLTAYGDGEYIVTAHYKNGWQDQTAVWFGIPQTTDPIPQPVQEPRFTSFSHEDELISPVTIEWECCTDPAANLIWVGLDNSTTGEEYNSMFPVDACGFDQPLELNEGFYDEVGLGYEVWYFTHNNDGIYVEVGKYSEIDYEFTVALVSEKMVRIPGGEFQMGDSLNEGSLYELPVHTAALDSFFMSTCEITNQQYCDYLNSTHSYCLITITNGVVYQSDSEAGYAYCDTSSSDTESQIAYNDVSDVFSVRAKDGRDMSDDPMVQVSWYGAAAYCNWRSQQEGYQGCYDLSTWDCNFTNSGFRLPTEAEWEYAARGGEQSPYYRFPWGDTISHSQANYYSSGNYSYDMSPTSRYHPTWDDGVYPYTSPVESFAANGYGLYDMAGNVFEWCNDWYDSGYYDYSPTSNPTGPTGGADRVLRGGSWHFSAAYCRIADRDYHGPGFRYFNHGFRPVLHIE